MKRCAVVAACTWLAACAGGDSSTRAVASPSSTNGSSTAVASAMPAVPTNSAPLPTPAPQAERDPSCGPIARTIAIRLEAVREALASDALPLTAPRYAGFIAQYALERAYGETERITKDLAPKDAALASLMLPFPAHGETIAARYDLEELVLDLKEEAAKLRRACAKDPSDACASLVKNFDIENTSERSQAMRIVKATGKLASLRDAYAEALDKAIAFRNKFTPRSNESEDRAKTEYQTVEAKCGLDAAALSSAEAAEFIGRTDLTPLQRRVVLVGTYGKETAPRLAIPMVHRAKGITHSYLVAPTTFVGSATGFKAQRADGTLVDAQVVMLDDRTGVALLEAKDLGLESGVLPEVEGTSAGQSLSGVAIVSSQGKLNDADGPLTVKQTPPHPAFFVTDVPPGGMPALVSGLFTKRGALAGMGTWFKPEDTELAVIRSSTILTTIERYEAFDFKNAKVRRKLQEQGIWLSAAALSDALPQTWAYFIFGPELALKLNGTGDIAPSALKQNSFLAPAIGKLINYVEAHGGIDGAALRRSLRTLKETNAGKGAELSFVLRDGEKVLVKLRWAAGRYVLDDVRAKAKTLLTDR